VEWHHHPRNVQKLKYSAKEERSVLLHLKLSLLQATDHRKLSPFTSFNLFLPDEYQREICLFPLTLCRLFCFVLFFGPLIRIFK